MAPRSSPAAATPTGADTVGEVAAIERRKLGDLLLDQTDGWTAHALARLLHVFEQTPVATALVGIEPLRSTFLRTMVAGTRRKAASGIG